MKNTHSRRIDWLLVTFLMACHGVALAQQGVEGNALTNNFQFPSTNFPSQAMGPTTPGSGQFGASFMGTSALPGAPQGVYVPTGLPLESWGPLGVYPHLRYSLTYGNGIEASPGVNSTTAINTVAPGLLFTLGGHWILDYTPSLSFYSNPLFHDTTDQMVMLRGSTTYRDWTLILSQGYVNSTQPLVETGTQVAQEAYTTAFYAAWQMNDKMALQLGLNQNFRTAEELNSLHEWTTSDWLNYQLEPQLGAAIGLTGGYDEVSLGSDMPFEEVLGRVIFQPGAKLSLIVVGGAEERQFIHPSSAPFFGPIFNASALYKLFEGTLLTVSGSREVTPSFYGNEINVITAFTGRVRQDITKKVYFEFSGGYTSEPFTSIVAGPLPQYYIGTPPRTDLVQTRSDTRTYVQVRLSAVFRTRLTASIFYMHTEDASSQSNFTYSGNQVGLDLNYRY
jgi:hypothetical protein